MGKCATVSYMVSLVAGVAMLVTGVVVLVLVFPLIFEKKVNESLVLTAGSESAERFVKSPVPSYLSFYFFHVENIDGVNTRKEKPILIEKGPYIFRQEKEKNISNWNKKFGTVTYREDVQYHFETEMSGDSKLSDVINHLNFPAISLEGVLKTDLLKSFVTDVDEAVKGIRGNLIEQHTTGELIFDTFSIIEYFPKILDTLIQALALFPDIAEKLAFAFYQNKNGTRGLEYTVSTGSISLKDFGEIKYFNKSEKIDYWPGDACNAINGTDGLQFPPGVNEDSEIYVYSADVCRSLKFQYEKDVNVEGIPALRFVVPPKVFADPNKDKDNMCFCTQKKANGECPSKAGVIPLSTCQGGKPVMASSPYFYLGEKEYHQKFDWKEPSKDKHQTFLDIEPLTGQVISAAKRIQMNFLVQHDPRLQFMNNTFIEPDSTTYFPMFWVQEGGTIDKESAEKFKKLVLKPYRTGKWSFVALIIAGTAITLLVTILILIKQGRGHRRSFKF